MVVMGEEDHNLRSADLVPFSSLQFIDRETNLERRGAGVTRRVTRGAGVSHPSASLPFCPLPSVRKLGSGLVIAKVAEQSSKRTQTS